jgi:hypothetical protein
LGPLLLKRDSSPLRRGSLGQASGSRSCD